MRNLTEQMLLAQKGGVVTDGLLLWIDGSDAPDGFKVKNRVTDAYSVQPFMTQTPNNLQMSNTGNLLYVNGGAKEDYDFWWKDNNVNGSNAQTLEVSVGQVEYSVALFTQLTDVYFARLYIDNNQVGYGYGNRDKITISHENIHHVIARPGKITINGTNYTTNVGFSDVMFDRILKYRRWRKDAMSFEIGAIRAYNRVLSDAEVLQNYQHEQRTRGFSV